MIALVLHRQIEPLKVQVLYEVYKPTLRTSLKRERALEVSEKLVWGGLGTIIYLTYQLGQ